MQALVNAFQAVHGRLGDHRRALLAALARVVVAGPEGRVRLDQRRQAIASNYLVRIQPARGGSPTRLAATVPGVDQTFGGLFEPGAAPPSATEPRCRRAPPPPWSETVTAAMSR
jgi:branched-chain amino acid transport system substrate-binding protein